MSLQDQTTLRIIVYEGDGAQKISTENRFAAMSALLARGFAVTRVTTTGPVARQDKSSLLVLGAFEGGRTPQAEDASGGVAIRFHDIAGLGGEQIAELLAGMFRSRGEEHRLFPNLSFRHLYFGKRWLKDVAPHSPSSNHSSAAGKGKGNKNSKINGAIAFTGAET